MHDTFVHSRLANEGETGPIESVTSTWRPRPAPLTPSKTLEHPADKLLTRIEQPASQLGDTEKEIEWVPPPAAVPPPCLHPRPDPSAASSNTQIPSPCDGPTPVRCVDKPVSSARARAVCVCAPAETELLRHTLFSLSLSLAPYSALLGCPAFLSLSLSLSPPLLMQAALNAAHAVRIESGQQEG